MTKTKTMLLLMSLLVFLFVMVAAQAEQAPAISMEHPYFKSLANIGLDKDQIPEFMALTHKFTTDIRLEPSREIAKNEPDLDRRIKKGLKRLNKRYVKAVGKLLNDDQMTRFPAFQKELTNLLTGNTSLKSSAYEKDQIEEAGELQHN